MLKLIILAPLVGATILGLFGKKMNERLIGIIACSSVAISALTAFYTVFGVLLSAAPGPDGVRRVSEHVMSWMRIGGISITDFGYVVDPLSGIMVLFVTGVGFLIHVFATGYMHGDESFYRFFAYLNLFMFMMLNLILGDNFLLMFVGWEGVGLCSYLLIGYYFLKKEAGDAAKKAFIANRVGDFGVVLGVLLIFFKCGSINFQKVMAWAATQPMETLGMSAVMAGGLTTIALLLFIGATGKSAQIPLYVWLPDAMAGPTPVSALIHAATMVTAGVYMVVRCNAIFTKAPSALLVVAIIGGLTAFFAATIGIAQWDIKKVLAYSTVSQLGYMFLACGVGAYAAAIFHVMTHAFFKALLFLGSGSVIHGMHHEQDMRYMGALKKYMKATYWTMTAGWLAICGIPIFAGFFSKDEILWKTFSTTALPAPFPMILWGLASLTALLTAVYMTRLMTVTFDGAERYDQKPAHHDDHGHGHGHDDHGHGHGHAFKPHESPLSMVVPLAVLAVLSVFGGLVGVPHILGGKIGVHNYFEEFLEPVIAVGHQVPGEHGAAPAGGHGTTAPAGEHTAAAPAAHAPATPAAPAAHAPAETHSEGLEFGLMGLSVVLGVTGILLGKAFFGKNPLWQPPTLLEAKYYVDEIYEAAIIKPIENVSREGLWKIVDVKIVDGAVNGAGRLVAGLGDTLRYLQSGFSRTYAAFIFVGAVLLIGYFFINKP
ncbi:MAG: NADH-quinone oxidoreductase subunit L [Blastocatellia bacterium]|nr:NADH-quinone oxidoreductase subunit L [Blastocatellia bacterium]